MFTLPQLPFEKTALEPHISANTLEYHYGKHHQAYIDNLNKLVEGGELVGKTLEEIILATKDDSKKTSIFNNAAQVYNHTFFWNSLRPRTEMSANMKGLIDSSFGSFEEFVTEFKTAATTQFGSGWAWLVKEGEELKIIKTANADSAIAHGLKPLLTIDVWEHAYYLDYQNRRPDFVEAIIRNLLNWEFAESNL